MIVLFIIVGIPLGIYGYLTYYKGERHGLLYIYGSILFMVIAPIIAFAITFLYLENIKDEIIYRRASYGWVTCHLPAGLGPLTIFGNKELKYPAIFSMGYLGFLGLMTVIRKHFLKIKLTKNGIIPKEFFDILNSKEDKNERP